MSFTFTGAGGGTFNVSGIMPTIQANIGNNNWAAGHRDDATTSIEVAGVRARGSGRYDFAFMVLNRVTVGTSTINVDTCDPDVSTCADMGLLTNISEADQNFDFICFLETGSLAITEISSGRVKGTFTGTGTCLSSTGASTSFSVTGGTFDVPLVTTLPG